MIASNNIQCFITMRILSTVVTALITKVIMSVMLHIQGDMVHIPAFVWEVYRFLCLCRFSPGLIISSYRAKR